MNGRPPQLSPLRLLAGLVVPLAAYLMIRAAIGSATGALAITEALAAAWLLVVGIARHRLDPIAVVSTVTVAIALAVYALTGGDPLALKLRRGAVTGTLGIAALASVALGRPLLLQVAKHIAKLNPDRRPEIEARLSEPDRQRAVTILTAIIGLTFAIDGASQITLALTVPTGMFVADSTAARIVVLGIGLTVTFSYFRHQKQQRERETLTPQGSNPTDTLRSDRPQRGTARRRLRATRNRTHSQGTTTTGASANASVRQRPCASARPSRPSQRCSTAQPRDCSLLLVSPQTDSGRRSLLFVCDSAAQRGAGSVRRDA